MRAREFIIEGKFNWNEYASIPIKDRITIIESLLTNKNLLESNDIEYADFFQELINSSIHAVNGNSYIVCVIALVSNTVILVEPPVTGEFVDTLNDEYKIKTSTGIKDFPDNYHWREMLAHTFFFNNWDEYNKFRTVIKLRFNKDLPDTGIK
jgi:hypothetical protein